MATPFRLPREITLEEALEAVREGALLVTANQRLARRLIERYHAARQEAGEEVWSTPQILPWGAWLDALWEQRVYRGAAPVRLSAEQERLLWERVIEHSEEAKQLLSIARTAQAAAASWHLMQAWQLDRGEIAEAAGDDARAFLAWATEFQRACDTEDWLDPARVASVLADSLPAEELPGRILLAGFDERSPQQRALIDAAIRAGAEVDEVVPHEAAAGIAVRVACKSRREEIAAAARWARGLLEREGTSAIGVVVQGLESRRREVESVFASVFSPAEILPGASPARRRFNLSAGARLIDYPLVHAAFVSLALDPDRNEIGPFGALLRSRYLRGAEEERSMRAALDAKLRRMGAAQVSVRLVRRLARREQSPCPLLRRALAGWQRLRSRQAARMRASGWSRALSELLAQLGWPGDAPLSSGEYQVGLAWNRLLSEFARLDAIGGQMKYADAVARLKRMASEEMFQAESAPAPVQVLGMLEAAGERFDHLWIAGMDDESWPEPAQPDPFLPVSLQRAQGLPHSSAERELEFARTRTARLLAAAPDIVVSHAERADDRELGPSPLIRAIAAQAIDIPEYASLTEAVRAAADVTVFEDAIAPALPDGAPARGGARVFQYQALCPFRAFAELRLGAAALETPENGLGKRERGVLIHAALENVWRELGSQARLRAAADRPGAIRKAVAEAIESLRENRGGALPARLIEIERRRVERIVSAWLDLEEARPPFTVEALEDERMVEIEGVRAKVRIDRIDRLEDGRTVLIDYKTGKCQPSDWEGARPSEPQVPLYAVNQAEPLGAVAFAQVKAGDLGFKGVAAAPSPLKGGKEVDLPETVAQWREALEGLAAAFRAGRAEVDPKKPAVCERCTLAALCRIAEIAQARPEED